MPRGFRAGITRFAFTPAEAPRPAQMNLTVIAADRPTPDFAAVFTRNAIAGAPVLIGRRRLDEAALGAIVINNKVSNVAAPGGVEDAERVCAAAGRALGIPATAVMPSSTGVIGWKLPVEPMLAALPAAVMNLDGHSLLPAAEAIMTTDLFPKVRRADVGGGSVVAIAKGAGMIEPNMATMLVFVLADLAVPRALLRPMLSRAVDASFNRISIDSDTSTSDMVVAWTSGLLPCPDTDAFERALTDVCTKLAADVVRNGEGVHHVIRVSVTGAPDRAYARGVGLSIANAPLVKTAICGNDPNVGRLAMAIGKYAGAQVAPIDLARLTITLGGERVFDNGAFALSPAREERLVAYLREAELYASAPAADGHFTPPLDFPPHERTVDIEVDLGAGAASALVMGADLSHEYISENADYRS